MTSSNSNLLCEQAASHYFDVLSGQIEGNVSKEMLSHIQQCDWCRAEIERLKTTLKDGDAGDVTQKHIRHAVITSLRLQYAYTGEEVACGQVKPFLPSLADAVLETRVPTPITTHLDNCRQCADDLQTIQQLNLDHSQLCRLGQLFAEIPTADPKLCSETKKIISNIARLDFRDVSPEILKHVCLCSYCRKTLADKLSEELGRMPSSQERSSIPGGHLLYQDLFNIAVPYGAKHPDEFSESTVSHLSMCVDCFERMLSLHRTLFDIYTHPQSGTVTRFQLKPLAQGGEEGALFDDADWPIAVEVTHKAAVMNKPKQVVKINLKPFIKPAAVAAVLLFALFLYFGTSSARAIDLLQIFSAVAKAANIHIVSFVSDKTEPVQEQWVARAINISIFKTPTEMILWDIPNSSRRVKNLSTGAVEKTPLSDDMAAGIKKNLEGTLSLRPFDDLSKMPQGAKWQEVTSVDGQSATADTKAYDLTWTEAGSAGSVLFKKWRVFLDVNTNLPQRIEWYQKIADKGDYALTSYVLVDYLTEGQIQTVVRDAAF
jgi:hypothetical protein